jgi:hypothetical protein
VGRSEVRQAEGVKIYFDPVSTAAREESARALAAQVLADADKKNSINTVRHTPCTKAIHMCVAIARVSALLVIESFLSECRVLIADCYNCLSCCSPRNRSCHLWT